MKVRMEKKEAVSSCFASDAAPSIPKLESVRDALE